MHVKVRLFAILRERAGWRERDLELPAGSSIEDAWRAMVDLESGPRAGAGVGALRAQAASTPRPTSDSPTVMSWR